MSEQNKAIIEIITKVDNKGIVSTKKELSGLETQSKKLSETIVEGNNKSILSFAQLGVKLYGFFMGLKQVIQFANETIQAHLANARAVKTLEASYQALGITGTQALKNAKAFAGEMQNATGIADEVFLDAQRMLANFGVVGQKAQEAIKAAYALSVGRNMEFASALDLVTRAAAEEHFWKSTLWKIHLAVECGRR